MIVLDGLEQEYLVRLCETAVEVRQMRQLHLWSQGPVQCLLPHHALVCIQFGQNDELIHFQCVDRLMRDDAFVAMLCDAGHGLAVRLARAFRGAALPVVVRPRPGQPGLADLCVQLQAQGLDHAMVHSAGELVGGTTVFMLFGMGVAPGPRQQFLFDLILPSLHLAFLRAYAGRVQAPVRARSGDVLSERENEIVTWVMHGKSNFEIGAILNISTLTVKNHLQKIYRKLNVHTRVQAVSRCWDLQRGSIPASAPRSVAKARAR